MEILQLFPKGLKNKYWKHLIKHCFRQCLLFLNFEQLQSIMKQGMKKMFCVTHSTHFNYSYMASDIW